MTISLDAASLGYPDVQAFHVENLVTGDAMDLSVEGQMLVIRARLEAGATAVYWLIP